MPFLPRRRSLDHLPAGLEPAPRFLDRVALHYARNALAASGELPGQVPLILGIWGHKVGGRRKLEKALLGVGECAESPRGEQTDNMCTAPIHLGGKG